MRSCLCHFLPLYHISGVKNVQNIYFVSERKIGSKFSLPPDHILYTLFFIFRRRFSRYYSIKHFLPTYRFEYPIRDSSTAFAASLPSRIAHTTRDCPLCISPAVKTPRYAGLILLRFCLYICSSINSNLKCIRHIFLASKETSCDQNYICRDHFFRSLYRNHHHTSCLWHLSRFQLYDPALQTFPFLSDKLCNGCLVYTWIMSKTAIASSWP